MPERLLEMNVNDHVLVRLTPYGLGLVRAHFVGYPTLIPPPDSNGWREFLLWNLMQILGPQSHMGAPQTIVENRVRLLTAELREVPDVP